MATEIAPGQVKLYSFSLDEPASRSTLSPDELARADRFLIETVRRRFIRARSVLREVLASYVDLKPEEIEFTYDPGGKPRLRGREFEFNLAHSETRGLLGLTHPATPVGVDLEYQKRERDLERLARRYFSPREADHLIRSAPEAKPATFYRIWTLKEAFLKAHGYGLRVPLHRFVVEGDLGRPAKLLETQLDGDSTHRWRASAFQPEEDYAAAFFIQSGQLDQYDLEWW